MAKELVRIRQQQDKLRQTKTTLQCVSHRATVSQLLAKTRVLISSLSLECYCYCFHGEGSGRSNESDDCTCYQP